MRPHYTGATYELTQENMQNLIMQLEKTKLWNEELQRLCAEKDAEIMRILGECVCGEINARNCPVHQDFILDQEKGEL